MHAGYSGSIILVHFGCQHPDNLHTQTRGPIFEKILGQTWDKRRISCDLGKS